MTPRTPPRLLTMKPELFDELANRRMNHTYAVWLGEDELQWLCDEIRALSAALVEAQQQRDDWKQSFEAANEHVGILQADLVEAERARDEAQRQLQTIIERGQRAEDETQQALGKALGYPWFKDDQKNFPGATEESGVCVGEHVGATLALEAARELRRLAEENARLRSALELAMTALPDALDAYKYAWDELLSDEQDWVKSIREQLVAALRGERGADGR